MKSIKELRIESEGKTRILWHFNYWDGYLSGLCLWDGEKCWFQSYNETVEILHWSEEEIEEWKVTCKEMGWDFNIQECEDHSITRYFKVYKLPEEVLEALEFNHNLFVKYVGNHTEYDENGKRSGVVKPQSLHNKFYNNRQEQKSYTMNLEEYEVLGEFTNP